MFGVTVPAPKHIMICLLFYSAGVSTNVLEESWRDCVRLEGQDSHCS